MADFGKNIGWKFIWESDVYLFNVFHFKGAVIIEQMWNSKKGWMGAFIWIGDIL